MASSLREIMLRMTHSSALPSRLANLAAGVIEDGVFKPTNIGTPQGGVVSPLLANIVLNQLDWALDNAGFKFVRYADDFVVLCQSKEQARGGTYSRFSRP